MDDLDGLGDKELIQSALRGDFELIVGYGEEHRGAWAGAWWDNEPAVRIVAGFTGDVAQHDAALRPRLRRPDRLVVESSQHSLSDLRQVREVIERALEQRATQAGRQILTSIGEGAESSAWPCEPTGRTWPASSPPATGALSSCGWAPSVSRTAGAAIRSRLPYRRRRSRPSTGECGPTTVPAPEPITLPPSHPLRRAVPCPQRNRTILLALPQVFCRPTAAAHR